MYSLLAVDVRLAWNQSLMKEPEGGRRGGAADARLANAHPEWSLMEMTIASQLYIHTHGTAPLYY